MRLIRLCLSTALLVTTLAPAAMAANPPRPSFREGKADFTPMELAITYAFGPGSVDFALLDSLSLGVAVDQVWGAQDWMYRATYRVLNNEEQGLSIALNGAAMQTREQLAGNTYLPPVWGYEGGLLLSFATDSGLAFRAGLQLYNTDWGPSGQNKFLFTPEVAYRYGMLELTLQPNFPFSLGDWSWVGLRLRI